VENSRSSPSIISHDESTIDSRSYAVDSFLVNTRVYRRVEETENSLSAPCIISDGESSPASSIISVGESTIDSMSYAIDPVLVNISAYRRVEEYRRTVGSSKSRPLVHETSVVEADNRNNVGSSSMAEPLDERTSSTRPYTVQNLREVPSVRSHTTEVADHRQDREGSQMDSYLSRNVSQGGSNFFTRIKAKVGYKFPKKSRDQMIDSHDILSRSFEENRNQSIDFLSLDGSVVSRDGSR